MTACSIPATATPTTTPNEPTLRDDERQPCEVWTRVMGYHRPVSSFNIGKKGEHNERRFFSESPSQPGG
jgi:hypothetical protein